VPARIGPVSCYALFKVLLKLRTDTKRKSGKHMRDNSLMGLRLELR
jgi:hypothetical protein